MRRVALAALMLLLVRVAAGQIRARSPQVSSPATAGAEDARPTLGADDDGPDAERDGDDDADSAPFTVTVERGDGRRCGGSLLSLRAVLTTADCAEGRDLRAGGVPVARVALAALAPLAVLQLREAPAAGARPIVVAAAGECGAPSASCYAVSVRDAPRLRVLDVTRVQCASGVDSHALCFAGPSLCASDRGAGVVCEGKLCGVLDGSASASASDDTCGDTHVAYDVTRARRFLHCAYTLRACGRGDDECAKQCTERSADDPDAREGAAALSFPAPAPPSSPLFPAPPELRADALVPRRTTPFDELPPPDPSPRALASASARSSAATTAAPKTGVTSEAPATTLPRASVDSGASLSFWEPNRPDFKKAGEYGDNAADYGGDESANAAAPASASTASVASLASAAASTPMLPVPPPEDPDDESDAEMMASRARRPRLAALSAASLVILAITRIAY